MYHATLYLPPGRYEYKFIINGEWRDDSACPAWVTNEYGTRNSLLQIW